MSSELINTSAPRGLKPGSGGFCTVAATAGLSPEVMGRLEALSGFEFAFSLSDPKAALNPVNFAHARVALGGRTFSVLSRVAFCGTDYSGRSNKIAHHFLLEPGEHLDGGPAWMMARMDGRLFRSEWTEEPRRLPPRPLAGEFAGQPPAAAPAPHWQRLKGDAGWAGMLAKAFREHPDVPAFVLFEPGTDLLPLFEEALAVLPPAERWNVGFATYYTVLPPDCRYHWRGILAGSSAQKEVRRFPGALVINLAAGREPAETNAFTEAARAGRVVGAPAAAKPPAAPVAAGPQVAPPVLVFDTSPVPIQAAKAGAGSPAEPAPFALPPALPRPRKSGVSATLVALAVFLALTSVAALWLFWNSHRQLARSEAERQNLAERLQAAEADAAKSAKAALQAAEAARSAADGAKPAPAEITTDSPGPRDAPGPAATRQAEPSAPEKADEPAGRTTAPPADTKPPPEADARLAPVAAKAETREPFFEPGRDIRPVEPTEAAAGVLTFDVPGADTFLRRPQTMAEPLRGLTFGVEDSVWRIKSTAGTVKMPLAACRLGDRAGRRVLECTLAPEGLKKRDGLVRWLVVEVADAAQGRVYQCPLAPLKARQVSRHVQFGYYVEDAAPQKLLRHKPQPVELPRGYPWIESLRVAVPGDEQPRPLTDKGWSVTWPAKAGGGDGEREVRFRLDVEAKPGAGVMLKPVLETSDAIERAAGEAARGRWPDLAQRLGKLDQRRKELAETETRLRDAAGEQKKELEATIGKCKADIGKWEADVAGITAEMADIERPTRELMEAARTALKAHSPLEVIDGWGLPLATVTLELAPCEPARLIQDKNKAAP